uniref:Uncharacterized protein n=1 Tax=Rousettus aegyptiacus TaxID=9407 RepID=A0A7J8FIR7_ROUAE|nr:hypothetical protein HJG63_012031 [Rousettus aegyptiacus]
MPQSFQGSGLLSDDADEEGRGERVSGRGTRAAPRTRSGPRAPRPGSGDPRAPSFCSEGVVPVGWSPGRRLTNPLVLEKCRPCSKSCVGWPLPPTHISAEFFPFLQFPTCHSRGAAPWCFVCSVPSPQDAPLVHPSCGHVCARRWGPTGGNEDPVPSSLGYAWSG